MEWDGSVNAVPFSIIRLKTLEDIAAEEAAAKEWEALLAAGKVGDITLGTVGSSLDSVVQKAIVDFNFANPYSRILIRQYGDVYGNDFSEGLSQLNNDIITGNCPDILLLPQDLSFGAYAVQGVFADIYPYLQADETFDMADYRENVFQAYEVSEKLYALPIAFTVDGMYGKAPDLGGQTKWNMDEFIAFADRFPGSLIFENPAKTAVLDICLKANGGNMVDWASKDAGFDRDLLVKILAFANRFVDAESIPGESDFANRLSDGDIRLMPWFANVNTQMQSEIFGGSAVSYIGFPSEKGNGIF